MKNETSLMQEYMEGACSETTYSKTLKDIFFFFLNTFDVSNALSHCYKMPSFHFANLDTSFCPKVA